MTIQWHTADHKIVENSGSTVSVDAPDNVSNGDLVSLILVTPGGGDQGESQFTVPAGFELVTLNHSGSSTTPAWAWYVKTSDGNEPASYEYTIAGQPQSSRSLAITGRVSNSNGVGSVQAKNRFESGDPTTEMSISASGASLIVGMAANVDAFGTDLTGLDDPTDWTALFSEDFAHHAAIGAFINADAGGNTATWTTSNAAIAGVIQVEFTADPPTDEETFEASFEDASGRDPLPTALIERTPAKRLANHNVIVYKKPPYLVTKRLPIELDDYDKTLPGNMIWHKDSNDALFSMGRWAQIQGRRFTDNPTEVELTLRISDHTESFEEPT